MERTCLNRYINFDHVLLLKCEEKKKKNLIELTHKASISLTIMYLVSYGHQFIQTNIKVD